MQLDTPEQYARHLATYIASPTKIEALTRIEFGRAPALHTIANMRLSVEQAAKPAKHYCGESAVNDGADYVVPSLVPKAKEPRVRDWIRVSEAVEALPEDSPNPFLQSYRLTRAVAESVARDFNITAADILGHRRWRTLIAARSVVVKLLIDRGIGYAELGRRMDRDHTTIMYRYRKFETDHKHSALIRQSYARHLALAEEADAAIAARETEESVAA